MRLFYCCELPEAVQAELDRIARQFRALETRVTWVPAKNFHVTLKFLGEVAPTTLEALKAIGSQVAASVQRFELLFDTVGAFPNARRPRVLWIGTSQVPQALLVLHKRLEQALLTMGFEAEPHFIPHVTVGRIKDERGTRLGELAQLFSRIEPFACRAPITHLTLMESQLSPGGAVYTPRATWEFAYAL
ncbi:MAG: RNA 2',3'-cyclic phosphodiesterase [Candidatus Bipolaricaulota bacterium]|nr:RNA 2',3'-cyclic phosphodiesterase [Candidatus Bipolaricaulota bacterium]MDW8030737.1 RNA 2',3'-cyclic phosphodiesterase [Candidatus Bipolaricaulota bacterium]